MSDATWASPIRSKVTGSGLRWNLRRAAYAMWRIVASPVHAFLAIRRSMTGASVTLLVIGIVTLNIIWGYPWVGMFSSCLSLMVVGWIINWTMRPKLDFNFALPRSAPAGEPIAMVLHGRNQGKLPAMDLKVAISPSDKTRRRKASQSQNRNAHRVLSSPRQLAMIESGQRFNLPSTIAFDHRGIHTIPDVIVTSFFPFHLFRSFLRHPSRTQIAITPRPMSGEEDAVARGMLDAFGGWSHKLLSGDALDYTGSREYEVGMPVRRWDFTSWARLGRPIVREFQSPSIQLVTLIIDTSHEPGTGVARDTQDPLLERVLSLAATAVLTLTQRMVRVRLCLTCEATEGQAASMPMPTPSDCESMLIRLAAAFSVETSVADTRMAEVIEQVGRSPTMILTSRSGLSLSNGSMPGVTILRVDLPHQEGVDVSRAEITSTAEPQLHFRD